jgi:hypothetical protein
MRPCASAIDSAASRHAALSRMSTCIAVTFRPAAAHATTTSSAADRWRW